MARLRNICLELRLYANLKSTAGMTANKKADLGGHFYAATRNNDNDSNN